MGTLCVFCAAAAAECADLLRCDNGVAVLRLRCAIAVSVIMFDRWTAVALALFLSLAAADQTIPYEDNAAVAAPYYGAGN